MAAASKPSAFVIGATGEVGKALVTDLLSVQPCPFNKVVVLSRRPLSNVVPEIKTLPNYSKLVEKEVKNFDDLATEAKDEIHGLDVAFCCLGTTRAQAGSAEAFRKVDYDYVLQSAKTFQSTDKKNQHFLLVTSVGSNPNSYFLYPKTKGEIEQDVAKLGFDKFTVLRPGFLDYGSKGREKKRTMEEIGLKLTRTLAPSLAIDVSSVARAMRRIAFENDSIAQDIKSQADPLRKADGSGAFGDSVRVWEHKVLRALGDPF